MSYQSRDSEPNRSQPSGRAPDSSEPLFEETTVLIVEDEPAIASAIARRMTVEGWRVEVAADGPSALDSAARIMPDVVILDVMLPGMDGFEVCRQLQREQPVPVIMLTARANETDMLVGLGFGADDYMTKPFSISELKARIDALCRRISRSQVTVEESSRLVSGNFVLDEKSRVMMKNGQPIDLTQVEFQIMELFFRNSGTALVRDKILEGVWGENYYGDVKIVDVNIRRLRMKIEDEPSNPQHILTVWGYGYRWNP